MSRIYSMKPVPRAGKPPIDCPFCGETQWWRTPDARIMFHCATWYGMEGVWNQSKGCTALTRMRQRAQENTP